jgi:hypothetical protein
MSIEPEPMPSEAQPNRLMKQKLDRGVGLSSVAGRQYESEESLRVTPGDVSATKHKFGQ